MHAIHIAPHLSTAPSTPKRFSRKVHWIGRTVATDTVCEARITMSSRIGMINMFRNAMIFLALIITVLGISITGTWAQELAPETGIPREIEHAVAGPVEPAQFLAQDGTSSLIDRLRAIRGAVASDYSDSPRRRRTRPAPASSVEEAESPRVTAIATPC